ncbi:MAG TPA: HEPN domain-containing protein [Stellaceae bacterium]|nr:HEPN domain-containing protein [Stellaceae bacterium]
MTPEAAAFTEKAREFLAKAADMMTDGWPDEAGRAAYLGAMHAAQALIMERTSRVIRRHRGVHHEFRQLTENEPIFDASCAGFSVGHIT